MLRNKGGVFWLETQLIITLEFLEFSQNTHYLNLITHYLNIRAYVC